MKYQIIPTVAFASLAAGSTLMANSAAPAIPQGSLTVNASLIREGIPPRINWNIILPKEVTDVVEIDEDDNVIPTKKVRLKVTMIGVGISNGQGTWSPATTYLKIGSSWNHIYTGAGPSVQQGSVLYNQIVESGTTIQFASRYQSASSGNYSNWFYNGSSNVEVLKNGDVAPSYAAAYSSQASAEEYMNAYTAADGTIKLGPRDLIYAAELTHTDRNSWGFDMQDAVMLVNFEELED